MISASVAHSSCFPFTQAWEGRGEDGVQKYPHPFGREKKIIVHISSVVHTSSVPVKSRKNARLCLLQIEFHLKFPVAYEMDITIPGLVVQKLKKEKKRNLENLISLSKSHTISDGRTSRFKFKLEREERDKGGRGWKE